MAVIKDEGALLALKAMNVAVETKADDLTNLLGQLESDLLDEVEERFENLARKINARVIAGMEVSLTEDEARKVAEVLRLAAKTIVNERKGHISAVKSHSSSIEEHKMTVKLLSKTAKILVSMRRNVLPTFFIGIALGTAVTSLVWMFLK